MTQYQSRRTRISQRQIHISTKLTKFRSFKNILRGLYYKNNEIMLLIYCYLLNNLDSLYKRKLTIIHRKRYKKILILSEKLIINLEHMYFLTFCRDHIFKNRITQVIRIAIRKTSPITRRGYLFKIKK